jgi:hypothetical protein
MWPAEAPNATSGQTGAHGFQRRHAAGRVDEDVGRLHQFRHPAREPPHADPLVGGEAPSQGLPVALAVAGQDHDLPAPAAKELATAPSKSPTPQPPPGDRHERAVGVQAERAARRCRIPLARNASATSGRTSVALPGPATRSTSLSVASCITRCTSTPR